MQKKGLRQLLIIFLFSITVLFTGSIWWMDSSLNNAQLVLIPTAEDHSLIGTYYPGKNPIGILFLEGFGSDQIMMKPLVSEFAEWDAHMMTFDFSGHGRSPSAITFDNAASDRLAYEILAAKSKFKELSGLNDSQIFMIGHSMGARMALWAGTIDPFPVKGLVLLGCQVNLVVNTQASFFTGVDDRNLLWIADLSQNNPSTDILLITGGWDDILTPQSAQALLDQLVRTDSGGEFTRELLILPHLVHNYEIYSPRVIEKAKVWINERITINSSLPTTASNSQWRLLAWIISLLSFIAGLSLSFSTLSGRSNQNQGDSFQITDIGKFLRKKLFLWGLAIPGSLLLMGLFMLIPLALPVFNLIYVGFIGAYGFVLLWQYKKEKMAGTSGFLLKPATSTRSCLSNNQLSITLVFIGFVLLYFWFFANTGWFYVFPMNHRIIWLLLFIPFSTIGFYVSQYEFSAVQKYNNLRSGHIFALNMIGLFPFILFSILFWVLGSLSGMIGGFQGLFILFIVVLIGNILNKIIDRPLIVALFQAFCLQLLVLPISALFRF
jgi:predicted esterase